MTPKQKSYINRNLQAFIYNFGPVRIEKVPYAGFEIYYPENSATYLFYAEDIKTIDGWLYGAVQAVHQILPAKARHHIPAEIDEQRRQSRNEN